MYTESKDIAVGCKYGKKNKTFTVEMQNLFYSLSPAGRDFRVGPHLQVGNLSAFCVNTDNSGTYPGRQKPFQALSCCGLTNGLIMASVRSQTFSTKGSDISEAFWKLKQQLEPGCKTEFISCHKATLISEIFGDLDTRDCGSL